ncbi:MAG: transcription-repair coupling factor [Rhodocyclaceae bacterium]|nr:transcription-repair coupling factor [Rhodocyclaceae bacterium]
MSLLVLPPLPKAGQRLDLSPLPPSADALAISELARRHKPVVVITATTLDAQRLVEETAWFAPELSVHWFPDWETLPYDHFSPHQDLVSERLATLYALLQGRCDLLITAATTAAMQIAPQAYLAGHTFFMKRGERLDLAALREQLTIAGYQYVTQVVAAGEYAIRGGLIDLFPMGSPLPYRIELFDQEIESLRSFDPDTQRTLYPVEEIRLLPAREFPTHEGGRTTFRRRFREAFEGDASRIPLYRDVSNGVMPGGIEYYLPLFFDSTATLFDYLPPHAVLFLQGEIAEALSSFWRELKERHRLLAGDRMRPLLPPDALYLSEENFFLRCRAFAQIRHTTRPSVSSSYSLPPVAVDRKAPSPLSALQAFLGQFPGRVLIVAESPGRRATLSEYFAEHGLIAPSVPDFGAFLSEHMPLALTHGPISGGFMLAELALVTENELFVATARPRHRRAATRANLDNWIRDLSELKIGDPVVHETHGIGRYLGLARMDLGGGETEFLTLEYADEAKLYVPVAQLSAISRYAAVDQEAVELSRLGSGQWEKARQKAALQARDVAAELLDLYAKRAARQGHRFTLKLHDLEAFAAGFGFEETPDQLAAIKAVIDDMTSGKPMDRLVCGDVGFGKTEVALRAAFVAVADGRQVALLCPTTLLAEQHFQTFSDRFADWPVRVAELSRFKSKKEQAALLQQLAEGKVDIVIGTHRLLQSDVKFKNLGLVIIDEEHRFGVRQKEALKALRAEVDVLTLTATPIPRTLSLSLEGLRDISVIATPPEKRLAIKTFVHPWSNALVREACLREFKRGGQVYFLYNDVATIENMRARLEKLLPEAKIVVGHGQLPERELERVMREFTQQKHNLLLCSTIIETGIDNPHANTIIIHRADKFGLAQLHQLRGRVGRSHHQAYAYLFTDEDAKPSPQAQRRLEAIQAMEELGAGFYLAMHDLEIRGAGEVLGEKQSGDIHEVGFALYTRMLDAAIRAIKEGKTPPDGRHPLAVITEIDLGFPALLPDAYCPDVNERLTLYKRLSDAENEDALRLLQEELIDRFGALPSQAEALMQTHRLRLRVQPLGVKKLSANAESIQLVFAQDTAVDPTQVIALLQKDRHLKLAGADKLVWKKRTATLPERVMAICTLLDQLGSKNRL